MLSIELQYLILFVLQSIHVIGLVSSRYTLLVVLYFVKCDFRWILIACLWWFSLIFVHVLFWTLVFFFSWVNHMTLNTTKWVYHWLEPNEDGKQHCKIIYRSCSIKLRQIIHVNTPIRWTLYIMNDSWVQFIEISIILWTKLMIWYIESFRIIILVSPQPTSVKIVQKIDYIWINFDIGFLNDSHQKFNSKVDSDILNLLNNFDVRWLWWDLKNNSKNSCLNHQLWK